MFLLSWIRTLISWNFTLISWAFTLISWAFTPLFWTFTLLSWVFTPLYSIFTLISWILTLFQGDSSVIGEYASSRPPNSLQVIFRIKIVGPDTPGSNDDREWEYFSRLGQELRSCKPFNCHWLDQEDIKLVGEQQIGPGGFAEISEVIYDGRKVVLKSYCYHIGVNTNYVFTRFGNEVRIHNRLRRAGVNVVPLVGVYSTETLPFGLVYEYMEGSNLKQYLRNQPIIERLKLLIRIARCLERMHELDIVHEDFRTTNILVDKDGTPRIGGLGNAFAISNPAAMRARRRTELKIFSPTSPPESLAADETGFHRTTASDIYAFGIMIFEVLTGQPPFKEKNIFEATDLMKKGDRPLRSDHPEIPVPLWDTIEKCWHNVPSERISAGEAFYLLKEESRRISTLAIGPAPDGGPA